MVPPSWSFVSPMTRFDPSRSVRPCAVSRARLPWSLSRSALVLFWSLFSLGSKHRMGARRSFIRHVSDRHRSGVNKVAPSVEISNAFNLVNRSAVLRAARVHFHSFAPWIDCSYGHHSVLFTGSSMAASQVVSSSGRVQQGDPLGPVLFALGIHPVIAEARAATEALYPGGIDICSFFLDDGCYSALPLCPGPWFSAHWARGHSREDRGHSRLLFLPVFRPE